MEEVDFFFEDVGDAILNGLRGSRVASEDRVSRVLGQGREEGVQIEEEGGRLRLRDGHGGGYLSSEFVRGTLGDDVG